MDIKTLKRYETKLENADIKDFCAILDKKLEDTSPEEVVDYVAFAIDNIDGQIERIKDAQKRLAQLKKDVEGQKENIKIGGAKWLQSAGIDKLKGLVTSSMTIYTPAERKEVVVDNEDALINAGYFKQVLDKTAVKKAILADEKVEGAHIEITHREAELKINKARDK